MVEAPLSLTDWHRLLFGKAPASFLLEVLLRVSIVYLMLWIIVRLLGKRMKGQLSNLEMAVMLVLGAIAGGPTQVPQNGLVPAVVLLVALFTAHLAFSWLGARFARFEANTQGHCSALLEDGRLLLDQLAAAGITHEQLFGALRERSVKHLGELKRVYFEANGQFSLLRADEPRPGLSVYSALPRSHHPPHTTSDDVLACALCGALSKSSGDDERCARCDNRDWRPAIAPSSSEGG